MSAQITYFYASVTGNLETKKQQQRIECVLGPKEGVELVKVDITASEADKKKMRELAGDDGALPPQLAKGDVYLGDFKAFDDACENETLDEFLKL